MTETSQLRNIQAELKNATNGAVTDYTMTFTMNTPVYDGDYLELRFPEEIELPSRWEFECEGKSRNILSIVCTRENDNLVSVRLRNVASINAGNTIQLIFKDLQNSVSLRPTSSWSDILLTDNGNYNIAEYDTDVTVENKFISNILIYELIQSTKEPDVEAVYTIKFETNNDIIYSASIMVRTPSAVSIVRDKSRCFVITNSKRNDGCKFDDNNVIKITDAFSNQPRNYSGTVEVSFIAQNPASNQETGISLSMIIYDDSRFEYQIDQITSGLNPLFVCEYPCATCDITRANSCVTCPVGKYEP